MAPSLFQIRLRAPHTASDAQWAETFRALAENRGACDEVWFSTGIAFPPMAWHRGHAARLARYAEQCRAVGIVPSLQFQATLGHGDAFGGTPEEMAGRTWRGFTGPTGVECKACNCPRDPAFLAYVREVARLYAAAIRPAWLWIDDDLRVNNHRPAASWNDIGCWCETCLAAFAKFLSTEGTEDTEAAAPGSPRGREALCEAIGANPALRSAWERFSFGSIAAVARAIAEETRAVSPGTRFGYQHGPWPNDAQLAVFRVLREAGGGRPVGSRPGGGAYYDFDPNGPVEKALAAARQRRVLGDPPWIDTWLPEIETYPRAFASRTAQGILVESITSLAYGMNAVSLLIMDTRSETDEWYAENLLAPLAAERAVLEGYRNWNRDTVPAGLADESGAASAALYRYALTGVPVVPGIGKTCGAVTAEDVKINLPGLTSANLRDIRRRADERAGWKLPVVVRDPSVALVVPRVTKDGRLKSVMMLNARIDAQKPVTLVLRGVPPDVTQATWRAFRQPAVTLPLWREGNETCVTLPEIAAWNAGWLAL